MAGFFYVGGIMEHQEKIKYLAKLKELSDVVNDMIKKIKINIITKSNLLDTAM